MTILLSEANWETQQQASQSWVLIQFNLQLSLGTALQDKVTHGDC